MRYANTANSGRGRARKIMMYTPVFLGAILMVLPYYWMVIGAFKSLPRIAGGAA